MKFEPTILQGAWVVTLDPNRDERGYFARTFCRREFENHDIDFDVVQCNSSLSKEKGTLRGMHFQREPFAEPKLVRCIRGALYDVIVDLRPDSPSYMKHFGIELTEENQKMLFVPRDFAHGFLTMKDDTEVFYFMGEYYSPSSADGLRFDDPKLDIKWPAEPMVVSEQDRRWPLIR